MGPVVSQMVGVVLGLRFDHAMMRRGVGGMRSRPDDGFSLMGLSPLRVVLCFYVRDNQLKLCAW